MLTGTTIFTGLVSAGDVTSLITQYGYVIGGIILVLLLLAPLFLAKKGFTFILGKVSAMIGGK